jgi:hypothetical protein
MKQDLELKLQAWLDGELTPAESEQMRLLVATDPAARQMVAELQEVKAALLQPEEPATLPETREFYWGKIQRQIEREQAPPAPGAVPWSRRWRYWLAPLAGASLLAAVLILANRPSPLGGGLNQVSVTADGYEARTFRDQSSGLNFVFLQETGKTAPARTRQDGSRFMIDIE